ncbi:unnamed protein product [Anisakis simplex]|uniref:Uncharacterized protein n=1 Tax=Anisakis simplex TaxID=6269 RepID=A0A0M3JJ89_ANISI|nr:unnamed protein product [Anisakis simplex]
MSCACLPQLNKSKEDGTQCGNVHQVEILGSSGLLNNWLSTKSGENGPQAGFDFVWPSYDFTKNLTDMSDLGDDLR